MRLREAQWYFFDLDDTLHDYRKASLAATTAILEKIHTDHLPQCPLPSLHSDYILILSHDTPHAFTDGKTSHQYRSARISRLLSHHNITLDNTNMEVLLSLYETVLSANLSLKSDVLPFLDLLKHHGHKIAIISEGPQDAQERAIETLGLTPYVEYLATSNKLGVAKTEGLFERVLEDLDVEARDVVLVGGSWERDVLPAQGLGICWVHYQEVWDGELEWSGMRFCRWRGIFQLVDEAHREVRVPLPFEKESRRIWDERGWGGR